MNSTGGMSCSSCALPIKFEVIIPYTIKLLLYSVLSLTLMSIYIQISEADYNLCLDLRVSTERSLY